MPAPARARLAKIAYGGKLSGSAVPGILYFGQGSNIGFRTAASGSATGVIAFPGGTVQGIVLDPENWKTAYIIGTTAIFQANDIPANGAAAFTSILGNLAGVGTFHTVEYLTLPSGNAIVLGTDLGAYIMRVASPGVWKTLGDNLPHAPVFDSHFDAAAKVRRDFSGLYRWHDDVRAGGGRALFLAPRLGGEAGG